MMKILAAIGLGSALMLAPVLAYADDAAAKPDATMAKPMAKPAPKKHHHHHVTKKPAMKKPAPAKPAADAPKS
jgi:hypothetical protein